MSRAFHVALTLALLASAACGHAPAAPSGPRGSLEAELARLPENGGPGVVIARAHVLRAMGDQERALSELEAAEDGARARVDFRALAALWRARGATLAELGRHEEALAAFRKRLETAVSLDDTPLRAQALVDTAFALASLGAPGRADEAASQAELLGGAALLSDPETAERLAFVAHRLRDLDKARSALGAAERGYRGQGDSAGAARVAVLLATLDARAKGNAEALAGLEARTQESLDPEPELRRLRASAELAYVQHDTAACLPLAKDAVRLADRRGIYELAKASRIVLARCAAAEGDIATAARAAEDAADLVEEQRRRFTGEQAREEAGFEAFGIYRLLLGIDARLPEAERAPRAFVTMEKARARAHLDAVARSKLHTSVTDPATSALLQDKAEAEEEVRRLTQALARDREAPGIAERHRNALWALDDIDDAIAAQNPLIARITLPPAATIADVQDKLLGERSMLVSYFVGDGQVLAVAVTKKGARLAVLPGDPESLERDVRAFRRKRLLDPSADVNAVKRDARKLWSQLLGPFAEEIAAHPELIVVPHGVLSSLPFETLVDGDGRYLVETHDTSYALSTTLAVELAKRAKPSGKRTGFVGFGDPVYERLATAGAGATQRGLSLWVDAAKMASSTGAEAPKGFGLERIPATGDEVRAIGKLFGADGKIYLRDEASEANVKAGALARARIVHIASHGILEPHYQALALTLDPAAKDDGFLLHSEIAGLSIDADLVVLSACQTGNTHQRAGEPVAGLSLALRSAGARRVVVSLWSVDDAATAKLMVDFYKPLVKEGAGYSQSLTAAKRTMLTKGPAHPYYWAPFVLFGP